jgi:phage terminase large subunit
LTASAKDPLAEFMLRYGPPAGEDGPVLLAREVFGFEPDADGNPYHWQEKLLRAHGRCDPAISVRSGHGPGKSAVLSLCVWHQMLCRYPQKTVVTAPTSPQLFDVLYTEVVKWGQKLPAAVLALFEIKSESIELKRNPAMSFVSFRTSRAETPEAMAGVHQAWVLLVGDEASGIPEAIFESAMGSLAGDNVTMILAGNPIRTSGLFFDSHHKLRDEWYTLHVNSELCPRVPRKFIDRIANQYGKDSNAYRVRVLGEFPRADLDTIIPYELVMAAAGRDVVPSPTAVTIWGLDVARFGDCLTALAKRRANVLLEPVKTWADLDVMQVCGIVKAEWDMTPEKQRPFAICVDAIGLGAGAADRLKELGLPVRAVNVSESPSMKMVNCVNLRTELWWTARQWFTDRACSIPPERKDQADTERSTLQSELVTIKYKIVDSSGKIRAEAKAEMKKRGYSSPDKADAFVLTFAVDASTALLGAQRTSWNTPLIRHKKDRD